MALALIAAAFLAIMPIARSAAADVHSSRVALVIGNAKYPDSEAPLKEPINDVHDIADELKHDGFDVETGENLTGSAMRGALDRLYSRIKPGSVALIFFSGYGIQSARQSYLIPVDAQIWTEADVRRDGADALTEHCKKKLGIGLKETTADGKFTLMEVECLGACVNAPMVQINDDFYEDLTPETLGKVLDELAAGRQPKIGPQVDRLNSAPVGGMTTLKDVPQRSANSQNTGAGE